MKGNLKKTTASLLVFVMVCGVSACGTAIKTNPGENLIHNDKKEERTVVLFSPMGKADADAENTLRTAQERTIIMADKKPE